MDPKSREKRLRVQSSRSSSGCQSCKARRVKCDERRPVCQNCIKRRIHCRYGSPQPPRPATKFVVYSVTRPLLDTPDLLDLERRSLYYFRNHAVFHMSAPFTTKSWINCVFQLAETHNFVMSALVALSHIYESYSQDAELRHRLQSVGLLHYNRAMREIYQIKNSGSSIQAILISCIVFYSIETLRGCSIRALQHVQSGLKIISSQRQFLDQNSQQLSQVDKSLVRDFLSLQNQIMELGSPTKSRAYNVIQGFEPPFPDRFESMDDALYYIEVLYSEIHCLIDYFRDLHRSGRFSGDVLSTNINTCHERIWRRHSRWNTAFASFEASSSQTIGPQEQQAMLILRVYRIMTKVVLENLLTGSCFTRFDPDLASVLRLIEMFLDIEAKGPEKREPTFSLHLGVIPPLFMIASRCNYVSLRDKSMELLVLAKRREGLWDSSIALQLAQRFIAFKSHVAGMREHQVQISNVSFVSDTACHLEFSIIKPTMVSEAWCLPECLQPETHSEILKLNL